MNGPLPHCEFVVEVSADAEWRAIRRIYEDLAFFDSPLGEWCLPNVADFSRPVLFFHGGWGKIAAAASTQYLIDNCLPSLLINLGTCGGFAGEIERGTVVLVERTVVYDIYEQMCDNAEALEHYSTDIDLAWLKKPFPHPVKRLLMVSADRDLKSKELATFRRSYDAIVGDWESGSIAWVSRRNNVRTLILRGVTDLVDEEGSEAYGDATVFERRTFRIMSRLVEQLPDWMAAWRG